MNTQEIIVIRGGGDLATGLVQKFARCGFKVLVLEVAKPMAIRRNVALCEAVYQGKFTVEDITATLISDLADIDKCYKNNEVPILVDPLGSSIAQIKPLAVIDAIIAKRNLGTNRQMAPITIALGPGFSAGEDVDIVIETMRGHNLGRLIFQGSALANTGVPGEIGGKSNLRVIHAPATGKVIHHHNIGDIVKAGDTILEIHGVPCPAPFTGLLRGLIREGFDAKKGLKIADIDPRLDIDWQTISDKARNLGGAALEAFLLRKNSL